jgi:hypothetical protein
MLSKVPESTSEILYTKSCYDVYHEEYYRQRKKEKYDIPKSYVLCFFAKDETELGEYYSEPDMDYPDVINSGYIVYDFCSVCKFPVLNNHYSFIYHHAKDEWKCTYLCIFNQDGTRKEMLPVRYSEKDEYYFRSLISTSDLTVLRITYVYIEEKPDVNYTKIIKEYFYYDFTENKFMKVKSEESRSEIFYFYFVRDNYLDDPFSSYNMEQTQAEFEEFNKSVRTLRNATKN